MSNPENDPVDQDFGLSLEESNAEVQAMIDAARARNAEEYPVTPKPKKSRQVKWECIADQVDWK